MYHARGLCSRRDGLGVKRHIAEQQIRLAALKKLDSLQPPRHLARKRQHRRMMAACFIESCNKMIAAWARGARANRKPAGQLRLAGCCKCRAFLMPDSDPFDVAAPNCIRQGIERIADQSKNLPHADLLQHVDNHLCHCPRHERSFRSNDCDIWRNRLTEPRELR
ncbi:hypothetical protein [Bradyrhizobium sp. Tv2a-2]|uniref:hypothetical protein n=1 Tax=Bradyrhizobium sp. Tv2a-2 TaxID=113395 RepID=UPI001FD99B75|nr:hypothetical protein [Bradyrhizobium sp. Tv2a-2]